ncbi:hypothetical protein ACFVR1_07050 [Psychrobacillus sp. NPDC058041]|uniref:hypothetical protein n=1 Tax=Psychrobacillus sp. NPDC058041 TaxID=3346310 RepID=UPI0036DC7B33
MDIKEIFSLIMREVFPAFVGAIVGLFISLIFDDSLRSMKRNIKRKYKRLFSEKNENKSDFFSIGNVPTSFFVIDGDGQSVFKPSNIECRVTTDSIQLPPELEVLKQEFAAKEREKELNGLDFKWNGPLFGLERYRNSRKNGKEEMSVLFNFFNTDYYTFLATNMQLNRKLNNTGKTIDETYIPRNQLEKLQPILANGFGVVLVIITSDENIILTTRTVNSGPRKSQLDISVVEGVHPVLDRHSENDGPDLYNTAIRGAYEELGVSIDRSTINFLGYGIDLDFYQWNIIGYAQVAETAKEIREIRSRGTSGKWENTLLTFKNFTTKDLAETITTEAIWSTAKVALYWTGVRELGKKKIDRSLSKVMKM